MNKSTSITLTPEAQSQLHEISKHLRIRAAKGRGPKPPRRATLYAAAIEFLYRAVVTEGISVVDLPALSFVSTEQARPKGGVIPAVLKTAALYDGFTEGLKAVTGAEEHLLEADARLIQEGMLVEVRGLNFTDCWAGTSEGRLLLSMGPHRVSTLRRRWAGIATNGVRSTGASFMVHVFDLKPSHPHPFQCPCGNSVVVGREPFDETEHDLCGICEVADIAPMSTADREALESEVAE